MHDRLVAEVIVHTLDGQICSNLRTENIDALAHLRGQSIDVEDEALSREADRLMPSRLEIRELMTRLPASTIDYSQEDDELPCRSIRSATSSWSESYPILKAAIRKNRPAVLISTPSTTDLVFSLDVMAITTLVPDPLPSDHVLLPWQLARHPRTGSNKRCAAVGTRLATIDPRQVIRQVRIVPTRQRFEIADVLKNRP